MSTAQSACTSRPDPKYFTVTFSISLKMEISLGTFPYDKWSTIFEQLNAVVNGPPPKLPDDGRFSERLQEFATAW